MKHCTNCNFKTEQDNDRFCAVCGAELKSVSGNSLCKACGALLWPNVRFCTKCGAQAGVFGPTLSAVAEPYSDVSISVTAGPGAPPPKRMEIVPPEPDEKADLVICRTEDGVFTRDDIRMLGKRAMKLIPERVAYYAPLVGVKYGRITVQNYKSKWGACNRGGDLKFNSFLMLAPPEVLDSVVVHELCHILQPNHSDLFYAEVLRVFPEYWKYDAWLDDHGDILYRVEDDYVYRISQDRPDREA